MGDKFAMKIGSKQQVHVTVQEISILKKLWKTFFSVKLFYSFQDPFATYLVMTLCEGGTLSDLINSTYQYQKALNNDDILFYTSEIICAIKELHGLGIVHRDLKTDNILLTRSGHIKLANFGLAIMLNDGKVAHEQPAALAYRVSI